MTLDDLKHVISGICWTTSEDNDVRFRGQSAHGVLCLLEHAPRLLALWDAADRAESAWSPSVGDVPHRALESAMEDIRSASDDLEAIREP